MGTEYIWEIKVENTPFIKRKCNRCNSDRFYCSDKFRVNAQKRNLDVWLIYRCAECDSTYNLTVLSRTKPESIKEDLFGKFSANDEDLAWEYAFSSETGRKNGVEFDYASVRYEVLHDDVSIENILEGDAETVAFRIRTRFDFGLRLSALIRSCFGLSAGFFDRMVEAEAIFTPQGDSLKKHKVRNGDIVLVSRERLQNLMCRRLRSE